MRCGACREQLSALVDGELEVRKQRAVEAHLAECVSCAEVRDDLSALRAGLAELNADFSDEAEPPALDLHGLDVPPPASEHDPLWAAIEAGLDADDRKARVEARRPTRRFPWLIPAGATSAILAGVGGMAATHLMQQRNAARALDEAMLGEARQAVGDARADYERAVGELNQIAEADRAGWDAEERAKFDAQAQQAARTVHLRIESARPARRPDLVEELAIDDALLQQIRLLTGSAVRGAPGPLGVDAVDPEDDDVSPATLRGGAR